MSEDAKSSILKSIGSIAISMAIVVAACIFGNAWVKSKRSDSNKTTIEVTGKAEKDFVSDLIVWSAGFQRNNFDLKEGYRELQLDRDAIKNYLIRNGMKEADIKFSSVGIERIYDNVYDKNDNIISKNFRNIVLSQSVTVESREVNKVEDISRSITTLIEQGIELSSNPPSYYYTKLADLKLEMLKKAALDSRKRCELILQEAGANKGNLSKSSMGVFQITGKNSSDGYEWGGTFNTSAKEKTVSVTVNLEYEIN